MRRSFIFKMVLPSVIAGSLLLIYTPVSRYAEKKDGWLYWAIHFKGDFQDARSVYDTVQVHYRQPSFSQEKVLRIEVISIDGDSARAYVFTELLYPYGLRPGEIVTEWLLNKQNGQWVVLRAIEEMPDENVPASGYGSAG